jgi:hypothetical protein
LCHAAGSIGRIAAIRVAAISIRLHAEDASRGWSKLAGIVAMSYNLGRLNRSLSIER